MNNISKEDYNKLLELLYQVRTNSGLRQADIAERLGVPQSFISKLESGERKMNVLEFIAYCYSINVDPNILFQKLTSNLNESKSSILKPWK